MAKGPYRLTTRQRRLKRKEALLQMAARVQDKHPEASTWEISIGLGMSPGQLADYKVSGRCPNQRTLDRAIRNGEKILFTPGISLDVQRDPKVKPDTPDIDPLVSPTITAPTRPSFGWPVIGFGFLALAAAVAVSVALQDMF